MHSLNVVLFGPPGSGKGTQAMLFVERMGFHHIAVGDMLRDHIYRKTQLGAKISDFLDHGKLAPNKIVISVLEEEICSLTHSRLLFDGFPRTLEQAIALDRLLYTKSMMVDAVIFLEVPECHVIDRIRKRALISGRTDDQDDKKVRTRLRVYLEETLPVAEHYSNQDCLLRIDGAGGIDEVFERIMNAIASICTQ